MPATEKTWRDQKLLHVVFGFSSILMLVSTIWMFAADHDREWKGYQRTFRNVEEKLITWRMAAEESEKRSDYEQLMGQLVDAQLEPLDQDLYARFKSAVENEAEERGATSADTARTDELREEIEAAAGEAREGLVALRQAADQALKSEEAFALAQQEVEKSTTAEARQGAKAAARDAEQLARDAESAAEENREHG